MTKIYGIMAKGALSGLGGSGKILCKRVFKTKQAAEAFIPEFRKSATTSIATMDWLSTLTDDSSLTIAVVELELHEDNLS